MAKKQLGHVVEVQKTWLSSKEAMQYLGCGKDTLRKLREDPANGIVISVISPKMMLYELKSLLRCIERHRVRVTPTRTITKNI